MDSLYLWAIFGPLYFGKDNHKCNLFQQVSDAFDYLCRHFHRLNRIIWKIFKKCNRHQKLRFYPQVVEFAFFTSNIRLKIFLKSSNLCTKILFVWPFFLNRNSLLKFIYSEKATKFCEIYTLLLTTVHTVKSKVEILQNFVAFSEFMNFTRSY